MRSLPLPELTARARGPLRVAGLVAAGWSAFACLYVMLGRLDYPYELEWMTGAILDHVERVRQGLPVYAAPSADFIPFLYPPLYYWVCAAVSRALPLIVACRGVSIASALVQAACVARLARRRGASVYWCAIGLGAFAAAFEITDFWYDIERPDSLFMAMVLVGAVLLDELPGLLGAVLSGAVLGLAFFAKQPASIFVAGGVGALLLRREWRAAAALGGVAAATVIAIAWRLEASTGGWFGYYVLKMPLAHGMSWGLIPAFFFEDIPHAWGWTIASAALVWRFARRPARDDAVFVSFLGASFVATMTSRLHVGGWANVLSFWTALGSAAIAVYGARLEAALVAEGDPLSGALAALLPAVAAAQLFACAYAPGKLIPSRADGHKFATFLESIRKLEEKGEVIAVGRGHLTTARHFHMAGLIDVVSVEHRVPDEVLRAFREQRFAAVVIDNIDDLWMPLHPELHGEFYFVVMANYSIARRIDEKVPALPQGWPARPRWVLLPRAHRLDEANRSAIVRRTLDELNLAQIGYPFDPDHVNDLARALRHVSYEAQREMEGVANP